MVVLYMNSFKFLTSKQLLAGDDQLDFIKIYGMRAALTDFSILLGSWISEITWYNFDEGWDESSLYYTSEGKTRKDRTGTWWTMDLGEYNDVYVVANSGGRYRENVTKRNIGARPAVPYSLIKSASSNSLKCVNGIKEIEYGEYPQTIVDETYSCELENAYNNGALRLTGKKYTTDSVDYDNSDIIFKARTHIEYEYNGSKYIRFVADKAGGEQILSDGRDIKGKKAYWVQVEPIIWFVDEKANVALSKRILFSGIQFNNNRDYNGDFDRTNINLFMNNCFSKEIATNKTYSQSTSVEKNIEFDGKEMTRKQNPYKLNFDEVSEEDIIRGAVESNVPVFLHGRPSEGKSARVKQLDPDCEIIYMRNATPDSLNGKSVYNAATGEMIDIPPSWYTKLKEKCDAEPDKIHIIFFDELTNALPSIQGMAFNIILDGEVNGKWKLPPNVRIVAAGNELNDSLAANQMAEPLFNRFAHVYINTTVDNWLKWASTPNDKYERLDYKKDKSEAKIHPSIYAYIAYKSYAGYDVLRTPYNGEKPNADPRKWEMASKILYRTKQPEMLRSLIGEYLTRDFIAFVEQQVISIEDIINHNYSSRDLELNISQKFAIAVGLSSVDDEHFDVARDFMKSLGAEPRAAFETMWAHGDEKRLEHLAEAKMTDDLLQGGIKR